MLNRIPRCLHTCLHCGLAVISERYAGPSRKLEFDGCWKYDITLPVSREECESFEESTERITWEFWEKWNWKMYVDGDVVTLKVLNESDDEKESCDQPEDPPHINKNNQLQGSSYY